MIDWSGYKWIQQERWGQIHPDKKDWWYDPSASFVDNDGKLHLTTKLNPKYFSDLDITSNIGVGLVSCQEKFKWGEFEIEAKLPTGENLWPAFWMWSWDSWPPEIDIFEGYSNARSNYLKLRLLKPLGFWNIQTNIHYTLNNKNKMLGSKTHYFGFKNPTKNFIKYSLIWERDKLRFYYAGKLVRTVTDKLILSQLNNTTMNVIINNGITKLNQNPTNSDFIINYFKYTPLK